MRNLVLFLMVISVYTLAWSDCENPWFQSIDEYGEHDESLADASAHTQIQRLGENEEGFFVQFQTVANVDHYVIADDELPFYGTYKTYAAMGRPNPNGWLSADPKGDSYYNNFYSETSIIKIDSLVPKGPDDDPDLFVSVFEDNYIRWADADIWTYKVIEKTPIITLPDGTVSLYRKTINYDHDTDYFYEDGEPVFIASIDIHDIDHLYVMGSSRPLASRQSYIIHYIRRYPFKYLPFVSLPKLLSWNVPYSG